MPFGIGPLEIIIVLIIALLIFGPKRLPELGRSVGKGMREFKESVSGNDKNDSQSHIEASSDDSHDKPLEGEVVHHRKS